MPAIQGKMARIRLTAATPTSSTNQAATLAAGGVNLTINATGRRRWEQASSNIVVVGATTGTPYAASAYAIDYAVGRVRFGTAQSTATTYTLDVPWYATSYLTYAKAFTVSASVDMLECTAFSTGASGAQARTYLPGLTNVDVTVSRFMPGGTAAGTTAPVILDRALLNSPFYLELIINSTDQGGYVGYGHVSAVQGSESVDQIAAEEISFKVTGPLYYTT